MSFEGTRALIAAKFAAEWPNDYPIVAENQPWPGGIQPATPWARYSIRPVTNITRVVDATAKQITGLVWVQIFVPEMGGTSPANKMGDTLESMFAEQRIATNEGGIIRFERVQLDLIGVDADGNNQWRATCRYREDVNV